MLKFLKFINLLQNPLREIIFNVIVTVIKIAVKKKALEKLGFIPVTSQRMIYDLFNSVYFPFKDLYKDSFLTQKNKTSITLNCEILDLKHFMQRYTGSAIAPSKPDAINITIKNPFFQDSGNFRTYFADIVTQTTIKEADMQKRDGRYWILAAVGKTGLKSTFYIKKELLPATVQFLLSKIVKKLEIGGPESEEISGLDSEFDKKFFVQAIARENGPIILYKSIQKLLLEKGLPFFNHGSCLVLTPECIWIREKLGPPDIRLISERVVLLRELMNILIRI